MDYDTLMAQHGAIDAAIELLLARLDSASPQPEESGRILGLLATLIRDHLTVEDPIIYDTVVAARSTRHDDIAMASVRELEMLKHDWAQYLYRWDLPAIVADWPHFVATSRAMLTRVRDRVARETAILYSLAHHYAVIGAGD